MLDSDGKGTTYVNSLKRIETALKAPALATATNGTVYSHIEREHSPRILSQQSVIRF